MQNNEVLEKVVAAVDLAAVPDSEISTRQRATLAKLRGELSKADAALEAVHADHDSPVETTASRARHISSEVEILRGRTAETLLSLARSRKADAVAFDAALSQRGRAARAALDAAYESDALALAEFFGDAQKAMNVLRWLRRGPGNCTVKVAAAESTANAISLEAMKMARLLGRDLAELLPAAGI